MMFSGVEVFMAGLILVGVGVSKETPGLASAQVDWLVAASQVTQEDPEELGVHAISEKSFEPGGLPWVVRARARVLLPESPTSGARSLSGLLLLALLTSSDGEAPGVGPLLPHLTQASVLTHGPVGLADDSTDTRMDARGHGKIPPPHLRQGCSSERATPI